MNDHTESQQAEVSLLEDTLPGPLFEKLVRTVRAIGDERMKDNGSYTTTFWYPRDRQPTNLVEDVIVQLLNQVEPGDDCIGTEWWLGRLGQGKKLNLHFDRDLALNRETGESVHPLLSSVLYLNDFPGSPTVVLDQVLAPDGKTKVPEEPEFGKFFEAIANQYVVFSGNLRHGVVPTPEGSPRPSNKSSELRLTLLVNYWHRRPSPPICLDYDGTIYTAFQNERA